jgi:bifunctional DNase/RNase
MIKMRVRGLVMDERSKSPIVVLQEEEGERILPIWIGEPEARAIGLILAAEKLERPMTHDLMAAVIKSLHARVVSVSITSLRDNTFFAEVHLEAGGHSVLVDARPSDSIALALRTEAALFVEEDVLHSGQASGWTAKPSTKSEKEKEEDLKKFLENLDPEDFGRFGL